MLNTLDQLDQSITGSGGGLATLSISNLELRYGSTAAFTNINLEVRSGEFVALLGPSGCGKTSLLRAIAGFNIPQRGRILLNQQDVAGRPPRLRNIGVVFQSYALFPHMTVLQNVCFGLECRGMAKDDALAQAKAALDTVGLGAFGERKPRQLSGGQQQRVALARAIVIQPHLLLLDEPLGALDKQLRMKMQGELKALQRSLGVTAIFVTHDQEEALAMADRIVVMRNGIIQQIATPDKVFAEPATGWVADFVNAGNLITGEVVEKTPGQWSTVFAEDTVFTAPKNPEADISNAVLLVPFHRMRAERAATGSPFVVTAAYPTGLAVDLHITNRDRVLRVQLPIERVAEFPIGTPVSLSAGAGSGKWLPRE